MQVMVFDIDSGRYLTQLPSGKCSWVKFKRLAKKFDFKQASTWIKLLSQNCSKERYTLLGDS